VVQVFVTSGTFDGNLGGLAGADTVCTTAAEEATPTLPGTWTAWLSDDDFDARDRIRDGEYQRLDGTVVANDKADLTDGMLNAAIEVDENGATVPGGNVWTKTSAEGLAIPAGDCQLWSTADPGQSGRPGRATAVDAFWTDIGGGNTCDNLLRLYCFADATSN
jgi:hypothetical protein